MAISSLTCGRTELLATTAKGLHSSARRYRTDACDSFTGKTQTNYACIKDMYTAAKQLYIYICYIR